MGFIKPEEKETEVASPICEASAGTTNRFLPARLLRQTQEWAAAYPLYGGRALGIEMLPPKSEISEHVGRALDQRKTRTHGRSLATGLDVAEARSLDIWRHGSGGKLVPEDHVADSSRDSLTSRDPAPVAPCHDVFLGTQSQAPRGRHEQTEEGSCQFVEWRKLDRSYCRCSRPAREP